MLDYKKAILERDVKRCLRLFESVSFIHFHLSRDIPCLTGTSQALEFLRISCKLGRRVMLSLEATKSDFEAV